MTNYAFVFARGGSKGLPRKNIKKLLGKPMIQYSIEAAIASRSVDKVFVSTEDHEIAEVARECGAIVIDRPQRLASDDSPEWLSWQHAINAVIKEFGSFDLFVSLPVTSPLRSVDDIENAIKQRVDKGADVCISITRTNRNPYFNMVNYNGKGFLEKVCQSEKDITRRQDTPEVFDVTTVVYVTTPEFINRNAGIFDGKLAAIEIPKERAVDIDDIYDFLLAEAILNEKNNR